jgi:hypothetical protein
MLKNPPIFSINFFTIDGDTLIAEVSDLGARCDEHQSLFPLKVSSADEPITEFGLVNTLFDGEGDIIMWELASKTSNRKISILND